MHMVAMAALVALTSAALNMMAVAQPASQAPRLLRPYVGEALLHAPHAPLPTGDALSAYTRDLLAPGFPGLTLSPFSASTPMAFSGDAPGLPRMIVRWWDLSLPRASQYEMLQFERELNGGCTDNRFVAQRAGEGGRFVAYATACPTDPPTL